MSWVLLSVLHLCIEEGQETILRLFRMVLSWGKTDYFSFPDTCKVGVRSENKVVKNMIFENKYFAYLFTYESLCTY